MSRRREKNKPELVELTSKPLKLQSALSSIMLILGLVLLLTEAAPLGILLIVIGLIWQVITRIRIWWNHG